MFLPIFVATPVEVLKTQEDLSSHLHNIFAEQTAKQGICYPVQKKTFFYLAILVVALICFECFFPEWVLIWLRCFFPSVKYVMYKRWPFLEFSGDSVAWCWVMPLELEKSHQKIGKKSDPQTFEVIFLVGRGSHFLQPWSSMRNLRVE